MQLSCSLEGIFCDCLVAFYLPNRPLTQCYQEVARSVFLSTGDKKRKSHSEVQEKVSVLWANAKLFDKGIKLFSGKSLFKILFDSQS